MGLSIRLAGNASRQRWHFHSSERMIAWTQEPFYGTRLECCGLTTQLGRRGPRSVKRDASRAEGRGLDIRMQSGGSGCNWTGRRRVEQSEAVNRVLCRGGGRAAEGDDGEALEGGGWGEVPKRD